MHAFLPAWSLLLNISLTKVTCLKWNSLCNAIQTPPPPPPQRKTLLQNLDASVFPRLINDIIFHLVEWVFLVAGSSSWIYLCSICLFFCLYCHHPILGCIITCLPTAAFLPVSLLLPLPPANSEKSWWLSNIHCLLSLLRLKPLNGILCTHPIVLFLECFDTRVPRTFLISNPPNLSSCKNEVHKSCVEKSALKFWQKRAGLESSQSPAHKIWLV